MVEGSNPSGPAMTDFGKIPRGGEFQKKDFLTGRAALLSVLARLNCLRRFVRRRAGQRACSKHGPYSGPYCPLCYERAMGGSDDK